MEMVVDSARLVAEGRAHPTPAQRVQALRFLGIGLFLTGRPEGAETAFFDLLRQRPERQARSRPTPAPTSSPSSRPCAPVTPRRSARPPRSRPSKHLLLAFLPPVGQFQNGDRARGFTLAAFEVDLAGPGHRHLRPAEEPGSTNPTRPSPTTPTTPSTLKIVNNVSVGLFAATVVVGIVDGLANFSHHDEEPPLASITPSGLTLRF